MIEWIKRKWCEWGIEHWPERHVGLAPMSITPESTCRFCKRRIGQDSQGGWFILPGRK